MNEAVLDSCRPQQILMDGRVLMCSVNRRSIFLKSLYLIVETYVVG